MNKAIFIDRDGVINNNNGHQYIYKIGDFSLNEGVIEFFKQLSEQNYLLIIISNQGGISKGVYTKSQTEMIHKHLEEKMMEHQICLTEIYYCPHHSDIENCFCRKPSSLMIEKAIARFTIDRSRSWLIGDSKRDIIAGRAAGLNTIKIESNQDLRPYLNRINETGIK